VFCSCPGRFLLIVSYAGTLAMTAACGIPQDQYDLATHERDSLSAALTATRVELDDTRFGAARLLTQAKAALDAGKFAGARDAAGTLLQRHPDAPERTEALAIQQTASARVAAAAATAHRAHDDSVKAEEQRLAQALSKVHKRVDSMRDLTFYYANGTSHYVNESSAVLLYIVKPAAGPPSLRFTIRYVADDWLFVQGYTIKADDEPFEIDASGYNDVERDNGSGGIWEWYDVVAGSTEREIAEALTKSDHAVIRYQGRQYYRDRTISAGEKRAIRHVLDAYQVLGGS
jgi:hypothetical protein